MSLKGKRLIDYKKLGIEAFVAYKFSLAKLYFSLAYENSPSQELLFFIELSSLGLKDKREAMNIYEFYSINKSASIDKFFEIINNANSNLEEDDEISMNDNGLKEALSYEDFKMIVKKKGFREAFEGIMFSTKLLITNSDDMLDFLDNLIENDFLDMGLSYIEGSAGVYAGSVKFDKVLKKLRK